LREVNFLFLFKNRIQSVTNCPDFMEICSRRNREIRSMELHMAFNNSDRRKGFQRSEILHEANGCADSGEFFRAFHEGTK